MSGLNDLFPGPFNRPDVPEFWHLFEILLEHDAASGSVEDGHLEVAKRYIPIEVIEYVAFQRAVRPIMEALRLPDHPGSLILLASLPLRGLQALSFSAGSWVDGFVAGAAYQKKYGKDSE